MYLNENLHTKHATATWVIRFNKWALHRKLNIDDIMQIPPEYNTEILCQISDATKQPGL